MRDTNSLRSLFLDYFRRNNHHIMPSSSLIPANDPTLMFTNAGMVQFKNIFTGEEKVNFNKAATSQKCVRAGGKHNDLDNVGYTARHHTFFEMLGNFSFGDYFKEGAIELAWNFLTKELLLPKDRLYVTIFHDDQEAYEIWRKVSGFADEKIIRISTNDNFWSMGDTGPCGPCSEIFYDHGEHIFGGLPGTKDADGDRFIEIWNLVFMQYEQLANGERIKLPKPCIDTGMGCERIAAVIQGAHNNYDIDLFEHLIKAQQEIIKLPATGEYAISYRVIADHLRSTSFLIADGVNPSNEGRGYVLRRIMRRAMRHAHMLGAKEPLLYKLVPALIAEMGEAYTELIRAQSLITETLANEEERFRITLGKGLKLLESEIEQLNRANNLPGEVAFKLYDTYGFPLDLTKDILRQKNIEVDEVVFEKSMQQQRDLAKAAWSGSGEKTISSLWFDLTNKYGNSEFLGYDFESAQGQVQAIILENQCVDNFSQIGGKVAIITNQTPFYGESGGQVGDRGKISNSRDLRLSVYDTKKYLNGLIVHYAILEQGEITLNDLVNLKIDQEYRNRLKANHSATHLLHAVMRNHLGTHVTQKGSLVNDDKFRFDISHNKPITRSEIIAIEHDINSIIQQDREVKTRIMGFEEATKQGAMALFGEKYDTEVRVVSIGEGENNIAFSTELCGGTHVRRTGEIGFFKIISESAIAAGIRRLEALTGNAALCYVQEQEKLISEMASTLMTTSGELVGRVKTLLDEKKKLEKALTDSLKKTVSKQLAQVAKTPEIVNGVTFCSLVVEDLPAKELRSLTEEVKKYLFNVITMIISVTDGKISFCIAVSGELQNRYNAVEFAKEAATILGGQGAGGKVDFAQGGGINIDKINETIVKIKTLI